jgi:mannitol/fructose-specific phosphotransferase system IIA component (Ntr-type)
LLSRLLAPDRVRIPLRSRDKADLIAELAELIAEVSGVPASADRIRAAVEEREAVLSTGIGGGIAIPHGKTGAVDGLVMVAGVTSQPIDFEALDGQPVRLLLMLVGPESAAGLHVKTLSRISRLLRHDAVKKALVAAESPDEFLAVVRAAETP